MTGYYILMPYLKVCHKSRGLYSDPVSYTEKRSWRLAVSGRRELRLCNRRFLLIGQDAQCGLHYGWIKLFTGAACQFGARLFFAPASLVGPVCCHRLIRLRHANNTRRQGNVLSAEAIRVAGTIPVFMMVRHRWHQMMQEWTHLQNLRANSGMLLDERVFGRRERASFVEQSIGQGDFAQIMQERGGSDGKDLRLAFPQRPRDSPGQVAHLR